MTRAWSAKLAGKLGGFSRIKIKGLESLQTVQAVNISTFYQKDVVEADFACGSLQALTKHAVLSIGGFELAPGSSIFARLNFHKMDVPMVGSELTGVPGLGRRKDCWR